MTHSPPHSGPHLSAILGDLFTLSQPLYFCVLEQSCRSDSAHQPGTIICPVSLAGCRDKATFLSRTAAALAFPQWFGHNWDALADCLSDMSWQAPGRYLIVLEQALDFCAADAAQFNIALDIFREAATDQADHPVQLVTLVDLRYGSQAAE